MNTRSQAFGLGRRLTCCEPGTTSICTPLATLRPRSTSAALRRSESRALVQLPTNTTLTGWSRIGCAGFESHVGERLVEHRDRPCACRDASR